MSRIAKLTIEDVERRLKIVDHVHEDDAPWFVENLTAHGMKVTVTLIERGVR